MPSPRRVGLKQVAALAGTSTATVSRVLTGAGYASEEARRRVEEAARRLGYQPNLRARGLKKQSSYTVGLIVPNLLNAYYTALADAIGQLLAEAGYGMLLASSRDDPEIERAIVQAMVGHDVAGLLWTPATSGPELLDYLAGQYVPVVSLIRSIAPDRVDTVVFQDYQGSYVATRHLLALGHRRIGYVGGDDTHSSNRARWQGFQAAIQEAGLEVDDQLVRRGVLRDALGFTAAESLLRLSDPPSAIFAASNAVMPGVMKSLQEHNVAVPDDVSLICFDDIEWFSFSKPPITAISVSCTALAQTALELLMRRLDDQEAAISPAWIEIGFELIVRGSTAPLSARSAPAAQFDPLPG